MKDTIKWFLLAIIIIALLFGGGFFTGVSHERNRIAMLPHQMDTLRINLPPIQLPPKSETKKAQPVKATKVEQARIDSLMTAAGSLKDNLDSLKMIIRDLAQPFEEHYIDTAETEGARIITHWSIKADPITKLMMHTRDSCEIRLKQVQIKEIIPLLQEIPWYEKKEIWFGAGVVAATLIYRGLSK